MQERGKKNQLRKAEWRRRPLWKVSIRAAGALLNRLVHSDNQIGKVD